MISLNAILRPFLLQSFQYRMNFNFWPFQSNTFRIVGRLVVGSRVEKPIHVFCLFYMIFSVIWLMILIC